MKVKPSAMERFTAKCRFDPGTGCVIWIGGTTCGRGHTSPYPSFWYEGRRWFGHRWAAKFIHGQDIDGMQVDHCCDKFTDLDHPNTLCVQHLQSLPPSINRELQWIRVQVGLDPPPPVAEGPPFTEPPFYDPPSWLPKEILHETVLPPRIGLPLLGSAGERDGRPLRRRYG